MKQDYKIVYWADSRLEADILTGILKECDIPCRILQESAGSTIGINYGALGNVSIAVPADRAAEAEALIIDWNDNAEEEEDPDPQ